MVYCMRCFTSKKAEGLTKSFSLIKQKRMLLNGIFKKVKAVVVQVRNSLLLYG